MPTFKEFAETGGLTFKAEYKGLHERDDTQPGRPSLAFNPSFHWEVIIVGEYYSRVFRTSYYMGLGRCSRIRWSQESERPSQRVTPEIANALANGRRVYVQDTEGYVYPEIPSFAEVLNCLQSDCNAGGFELFEDFASEFGYNSDSRAAEAIWRKCQHIRGNLRKLFGDQFDLFMSLNEEDETND